MKDYNYYVQHPINDGFSVYVKHHIIPQSLGGTDSLENIVYCSPAVHMWLHILLEREGHKCSARFFLNSLGKKLEDINSFEDCLPYNDYFVNNLLSKTSEAQKELWADPERRAKRVVKYREAKLGRENVCIDRIWMNNGKIRKRVKREQIGEYLKNGFVIGQKLRI